MTALRILRDTLALCVLAALFILGLGYFIVGLVVVLWALALVVTR